MNNRYGEYKNWGRVFVKYSVGGRDIGKSGLIWKDFILLSFLNSLT